MLVLRVVAVSGALLAALNLPVSLSGRCVAEDWTTVRGRIVYDGEPPKNAPLEINRDAEFCGPLNLTDDSLLVNPENHGVKNVAIWIHSKKDVAVHQSYDEAMREPVVLNNNGCQFEPRMLTVRTGQLFQATSTDAIRHNVAVYARRNDPFSEIVPHGQSLERSFPQAETRPIRVDCSVHAWMRAYLIITDHPYAAVTDEDGRFELAHVPQGTWTFRFWHERPEHLGEITQDGTTRTLKLGSWEMDVAGVELDLGDLSVKAKLFADE